MENLEQELDHFEERMATLREDPDFSSVQMGLTLRTIVTRLSRLTERTSETVDSPNPAGGNGTSIEQKYKAAFAHCDRNGDGSICSRELKTIMLEVGLEPADHDIEEMKKTVDHDKDGKISYDEFVKMMQDYGYNEYDPGESHKEHSATKSSDTLVAEILDAGSNLQRTQAPFSTPSHDSGVELAEVRGSPYTVTRSTDGKLDLTQDAETRIRVDKGAPKSKTPPDDPTPTQDKLFSGPGPPVRLV